jgi:hypothetical protein
VKKILIGGDSWGLGEWDCKATLPEPSHPGLEQYLLDDNFDVVNVSIAGGSNLESVARLKIEFDQGPVDHVIWFQSDPIRDFRPYHDFNQVFVSYEKLLEESAKMLESSYDSLNKFGVQLLCIGGCSKLHADIKNYDNLIPAVPSMIELLYPSYTAPEVWISDWNSCLDRSTNIDLLDGLARSNKLQWGLRHLSFFKKDPNHPDRHGHRVLYNFLRKNFI